MRHLPCAGSVLGTGKQGVTANPSLPSRTQHPKCHGDKNERSLLNALPNTFQALSHNSRAPATCPHIPRSLTQRQDRLGYPGEKGSWPREQGWSLPRARPCAQGGRSRREDPLVTAHHSRGSSQPCTPTVDQSRLGQSLGFGQQPLVTRD